MCVVKVRANRMLRLRLKFVVLDLLVCFFPMLFLVRVLSLFFAGCSGLLLFSRVLSSGNSVGSNCGPKLSELEG